MKTFFFLLGSLVILGKVLHSLGNILPVFRQSLAGIWTNLFRHLGNLIAILGKFALFQTGLANLHLFNFRGYTSCFNCPTKCHASRRADPIKSKVK